MAIETTLTRELPCRLSDDEAKERALVLARLLREQEQREIEYKVVSDAATAEIKRLKTEARRLARIVDSREEIRVVECMLVFEREAARAVVIRCDTQGIVETRAMTLPETHGVDAGEIEAGVVPDDARAQIDYLEAIDEINRKRAEFNLAAWAEGDLSDAQIDRLTEAGLCEVEPLLRASDAEFVAAAGCTKKRARELLGRLMREFTPPAPPAQSMSMSIEVEAEAAVS